MLLSIRDVTLPPDEVSSIVRSYQIQTYLDVILITILVYDSGASSVWILYSHPLPTVYQYAHLTKRYVNESLQCKSVMTVHDWQVKYFWVGVLVGIDAQIY